VNNVPYVALRRYAVCHKNGLWWRHGCGIEHINVVAGLPAGLVYTIPSWLTVRRYIAFVNYSYRLILVLSGCVGSVKNYK